MTNGNDSIHPLIVNINGNNCMEYQGLTKREYFAAMAMQGFLSNTASDVIPADFAAKKSVEYVDALIEQLNKNNVNG